MLGQDTTRTMRLLHIIGTMSPEAGGPTESVRSLITYGFPGYIGEVVTLDDPSSPFLKNYHFPVHALGPINTVYGYNTRLVPWLEANGHRFDGIIVNGLWQYCGFAARRVFGGKKPYVVFTHGMLDPYFKTHFPMKHIKKWVYWLLSEYWVLKGANRVLFTTEAEEQLAKQSFWLHDWKGLVVPYGASGPDGDSEAQRRAFFACCPEMEKRRFLLYLGRVHRKKGCDMLVDAFAKIAARDPGLSLVMAGPDQQHWKAELQERAAAAGIASRVHWPGMLKGDVKWGAFYASEAFILPSHQENFGIAVAEALACGRPVLLSDKVNIASEIEADGAGFTEPDTPSGTLRLLEHWIDITPEQRVAMGRSARECFDRRYDMRKNARIIIELFRMAKGEAESASKQTGAV
ncbi:MAG: glycosyltransferase [Acidobacteriaceae bacterium]